MNTIKRTEKYDNGYIIVNVPEHKSAYNRAMKGSNESEFMAIYGTFSESGGRVYWTMTMEGEDTPEQTLSEYLDDVAALKCVAAGGKVYH